MNNFIFRSLGFILIPLNLMTPVTANMKLKLQERMEEAQAVTVENLDLNELKKIIHVVKKGEYIDLIATNYGVSGEDVLKWNNLSNKQFIYIGQKLNLWIPNTNHKIDENVEEIIMRLNKGISDKIIDIIPEKTKYSTHPITLIKFSPKGKFFAYSNKQFGNLTISSNVYIYQKKGNEYINLKTISSLYPIKSFTFNSNEDLLLIRYGGTSGYSVWELTPSMNWSVKYNYPGKTYSATFNPNSKLLISTHGKFGTIRSAYDGSLIKKITNVDLLIKDSFFENNFTFSAFSPNGNQLVVGNRYFGKINFFDVVSINDVSIFKYDKFIKLKYGLIKSITFSPDSKYLAVNRILSGQLTILDVETGSENLSISTNKLKLESLEFSPDGKYISCNKGIWRIDNGSLIRSFNTKSITYDPSNNYVVTAKMNSINWWNLGGDNSTAINDLVIQINSEFPLNDYLKDRDKKINSLFLPQGEFENTGMYNERVKTADLNKEKILTERGGPHRLDSFFYF